MLGKSFCEIRPPAFVGHKIQIVSLGRVKSRLQSQEPGARDRSGRQTGVFVCIVWRINFSLRYSRTASPAAGNIRNRGVTLKRHPEREAVLENPGHQSALLLKFQ